MCPSRPISPDNPRNATPLAEQQLAHRRALLDVLEARNASDRQKYGGDLNHQTRIDGKQITLPIALSEARNNLIDGIKLLLVSMELQDEIDATLAVEVQITTSMVKNALDHLQNAIEVSSTS